MSHYRRIQRPGATVFLTINLVDRGSSILVQEIDLLREVVRRTRADKPFAIDAWVVLPDHMHCVWTLPEGDADYSNRVGMMKARFTIGLRRSGFSPTPVQNRYGAIGGRLRRRVGLKPDLHGDEPPIWQKRFWEHHIRDEADLRAHLRYCWVNPVKHGLCAHPRDWPYSSYHRDGVGADLGV